MAIYKAECASCGNIHEFISTYDKSDDPQECPECSSNSYKLNKPLPNTFALKGGKWSDSNYGTKRLEGL